MYIMENKKTIICDICKKSYSSQSSLINHCRNIHDVKNIKKRNENDGCYYCNHCKKPYLSIQSRWSHQKVCKVKIEELEKNNKILEIEKKFEIQIEMQKQQITELQNKLLRSKRLDNKTFKAVNKILMDRSYRNSNNNNNTNSNNVTNNNTYQILAIGNEELSNVLTIQQKKQILNSRLCSLEKIVEIAHCGEMNQFKNILITNLKDNYAYKYDESKGYFITVAKNDLLEDVIINRVMDIEAIYDELKTANKIDEKTKKLIQNFLDKIENNDIPFYDNETKYENFKTFKSDKIKILLYNNQDKITKDIALLISNSNSNDITEEDNEK